MLTGLNETHKQPSELISKIETLEANRRRLLELLEHYDKMVVYFHDESSYGLFREMAKIGKKLDNIDRRQTDLKRKLRQGSTK